MAENEFDLAALKAEEALKQRVRKMTDEERKIAVELMIWWKNWYMTAGHKRLGRIMINALQEFN